VHKFTRKKPRNILTAFVYRLIKSVPLPHKLSVQILTDLSWVCRRLAFERCPMTRVYSSQMSFILSKTSPEDIVLDLGCANGRISRQLSGYVAEVVGIDNRLEAISSALKTTVEKNIKYIASDAVKFLNNTLSIFDIIILSHIVEHLEDPVALIKIALERSRLVYLELPDNGQDILSLMRDELNIPPLYNDSDHLFEFDRDDILKVVENLGGKILKSEYNFGVMRFWLSSR